MFREESFLSKEAQYNIECLDKYDFSEFLFEGKSIQRIIQEIEERYDKEFVQKFGIYVFDHPQITDPKLITAYFSDRYNVWFMEYTDWVVKMQPTKIYKKRKEEVDPWN